LNKGIRGLDVFENRIDAYHVLKEKYYPDLVYVTSCRALIGYYILAKEAYLLMASKVIIYIFFINKLIN
jgi:hypothetical protein